MNRLKQFLKTSGVYFLGNTLSKLLSFLLLPLYTSKLSPDSFGYYDLVVSMLNLVIPIVFFQVWDGVYRFTFDYKDKKDKLRVISNGFIIVFMGFLLYSLTFLILNIVYDLDHKYYIYIYGFLFSLQFFYSFGARSFSKNKALVVSGLLNSFISLGINVFLIAFLDIGIESLYISYIIGTIFQIVYLEKKLKLIKSFEINFVSSKLLKEILKFSIPIIGVTLSYWLLNGLTRMAVSFNLGTYENGLFAVSNRLTTIIVLIVSVFQFAWYELIYSQVNDGNKNESYKDALNYVVKFMVFIGPLSLLCIKLIFPFMIDQQYQGALEILPIIFIGVIINSYTSIAGTLLLADKNSTGLLKPILLGAISNIISLYLLIKPLGLLGASISLLIAYLVTAIVITRKLKKEKKINISKVVIGGGAILLVFSLFIYYLDNTNFILIAITLIFLLAIYSFKDLIKQMKIYVLKIIKDKK